MTSVTRAPVLVLLNGAPGVGKSALAGRYLARRPDARSVEVDRLRMQLDGWEHDESTRLMARDLALTAIEESLGEGRDVLVPQYLGRPDFVDQLAATAVAAGARFVHIHLHTDVEVVERRFLQRRRDLEAAGTRHPEAEIVDVGAALADALARLQSLAEARPPVVWLDADDEHVLDALAALIEQP
jgi:predicted kinase